MALTRTLPAGSKATRTSPYRDPAVAEVPIPGHHRPEHQQVPGVELHTGDDDQYELDQDRVPHQLRIVVARERAALSGIRDRVGDVVQREALRRAGKQEEERSELDRAQDGRE